jgi:SAM-dependent methyltransferase
MPELAHPATPLASPWIQRWSALVGPKARVLDVACGSGRHVRWFAGRGAQVTALDRDGVALAGLQGVAHTVEADIEGGPWPLPGQVYDAVVVTNYLWRPLLPTILASVAVGGVLLYETFAHGNASVGKPSRPDFLLQPGELLDAVRPTLRVIAYEDGFLEAPPRFVQRIAAVRAAPTDTSANPVRWPLAAS